MLDSANEKLEAPWCSRACVVSVMLVFNVAQSQDGCVDLVYQKIWLHRICHKRVANRT